MREKQRRRGERAARGSVRPRSRPTPMGISRRTRIAILMLPFLALAAPAVTKNSCDLFRARLPTEAP